MHAEHFFLKAHGSLVSQHMNHSRAQRNGIQIHPPVSEQFVRGNFSLDELDLTNGSGHEA